MQKSICLAVVAVAIDFNQSLVQGNWNFRNPTADKVDGSSRCQQLGIRSRNQGAIAIVLIENRWLGNRFNDNAPLGCFKTGILNNLVNS